MSVLSLVWFAVPIGLLLVGVLVSHDKGENGASRLYWAGSIALLAAGTLLLLWILFQILSGQWSTFSLSAGIYLAGILISFSWFLASEIYRRFHYWRSRSPLLFR